MSASDLILRSFVQAGRSKKKIALAKRKATNYIRERAKKTGKPEQGFKNSLLATASRYGIPTYGW